jgi:hypothetical protein
MSVGVIDDVSCFFKKTRLWLTPQKRCSTRLLSRSSLLGCKRNIRFVRQPYIRTPSCITLRVGRRNSVTCISIFTERLIFACLYHSETPGFDVEIGSVIFGFEVLWSHYAACEYRVFKLEEIETFEVSCQDYLSLRKFWTLKILSRKTPDTSVSRS